MTNELDPDLRRLFAQTAEAPADEAFVAGVARRTSRERRILALVRPLAMGLVMAAVLAVLASGLGLLLSQSQGVVTTLVRASPLGWASGLALALAGAVLVRTLAPLLASVRR